MCSVLGFYVGFFFLTPRQALAQGRPRSELSQLLERRERLAAKRSKNVIQRWRWEKHGPVH